MAQLATDIDQMVWSIPYKVKKPILMVVTPNVLDIKLLHYLSTIQPCGIYLDLPQWRLKTSPHVKSLCFGSCPMKF